MDTDMNVNTIPGSWQITPLGIILKTIGIQYIFQIYSVKTIETVCNINYGP